MYSKPTVLPLAPDGELYGLFDEDGAHIGSGSREVCYTLLFMVESWRARPPRLAAGRANPRLKRSSPKTAGAESAD